MISGLFAQNTDTGQSVAGIINAKYPACHLMGGWIT
jgi:hypothetical protein